MIAVYRMWNSGLTARSAETQTFLLFVRYVTRQAAA